MHERSENYLISLAHELRSLPNETEWVEFKVNDCEPQAIGEYISALANSAALVGKAFAYLLWGICDTNHELVGTVFEPRTARVGNEELESWLLRLLEPKIDFRFFRAALYGRAVVILEIARATRHPVRFQGQEFVRVGSYKKKLRDFPEKERMLWRIFDHTPFEDLPAAGRVSSDEVLRLLDYPAYFELLERPLPAGRDATMTNASIRQRFGIAERNSSIVSRLLNEATDAGQIVLEDPGVGTRIRRYLPFWAAAEKRREIA